MPSAHKVKLGELLVDAGIITSGDLTEAIQVSRRLGVPIGQVLLVSRCVTDSVLEAALEAQPLITDGTISRTAAVNALRKSYEDGSPLHTLLDIEEIQEDNQQISKRLAELLLDSDIVTQEQLDAALETSYSSGVPLGSALVLEGVLSPSLFPSILRIQRNIREGRISRDDGIGEIKSTFLHWMKAEESLARAAEVEDGAELSVEEEIELLTLDDIHEAIVREEKPPGKKKAPEVEIEQTEAPAAKKQAAPAVKRSASIEKHSVVLDEAAAQENEVPRLIDILISAGTFNSQDIQVAFESILDDPVASGQLFLILGLTDEETVKTALRSHSLREREVLTDDEAVSAVKAAQNNNDGEEYAVSDPKLKRYFDPKWRRSATKVLGGMALGAAVAGLSLLKRKK